MYRSKNFYAVLAVALAAVGQAHAQSAYGVTELGLAAPSALKDVRLDSQGQVRFFQFDASAGALAYRMWSPGSGVQTLISNGAAVNTLGTYKNEAGQTLILNASGGGNFSLNLYSPNIVQGTNIPISQVSMSDSLGGTTTAANVGQFRLTEQGTVLGVATVQNYSSNPLPGASTTQRSGALPYVWAPGVGASTIPTPAGYVHPNGPNSGPPATVTSAAMGSNANGQVVGYVGSSDKQTVSAYLWSPQGVMTTIGALSGYAWNGAWDINDNGVVVGSSSTLYTSGPNSVERAFVWSAALGTVDLNQLLSASDIARGVVVRGAYDINNNGSILAQIDGGGSSLRWALLSAVPEPGTVPLMALGLAATVVWVRRAKPTKQKADVGA